MKGPGDPTTMRIAVIGSSGQIGSALFDSLRRSYSVEGFDLFPGPRARRLDIAAPDAPNALQGFDVICHLAARIPGDGGASDPRGLAETNVLGVIQALEAARRNDARFVFTSSVAVYGDPSEVPIRETQDLRPLSQYGVSKVVGEMYVAHYRELYGLDASVVRPFNVYSDGTLGDLPPTEVVGHLIRRARASEPLTVSGDGEQTRDFVHVSDVVQLFGLLVRGHGQGETVNAASGSPTRILDLAEWIRDAVNPDLPILHLPSRTRDVRNSWASIDRARSLGFSPTVRLHDWLRSSLQRPASSARPDPT